MYIYEMILDILQKNGPTSIPSICQEMNQQTIHLEEKFVQPSQVKSAINRKKELFKVQNDVVFIDPDKDIQYLNVHIGGASEPALTIKVDFLKNRFAFFEWHMDQNPNVSVRRSHSQMIGDVDTFKKELYRIKPWEWDADYQDEGLVLDGIYWSVKLVTQGRIYESEGLQCFPEEWKKLCKSLTKLTGFKIL
ncbi:hypothetical protein HHO41_06645 [Bacillus sp. DNRA2]|uniref:hypothetical protein n=1 Tax=Bacillus sp. DNRA2 TaxID=2723053 RepID=UPI00145F695C|nr:hypothetical protein [Bacillus sp. DNRA2]NMD69962.1 hypothetical protein [Bacillus sp. DNRA2]